MGGEDHRFVDLLYGDLSPEEADARRKALEASPEDQASLREVEAMLARFRTMPEEDAPAVGDAILLAAAREAADRMATPSPWARFKQLFQSPLTGIAFAGAAAAIVAIVSVPLVMQQRSFDAPANSQMYGELESKEAPAASNALADGTDKRDSVEQRPLPSKMVRTNDLIRMKRTGESPAAPGSQATPVPTAEPEAVAKLEAVRGPSGADGFGQSSRFAKRGRPDEITIGEGGAGVSAGAGRKADAPKGGARRDRVTESFSDDRAPSDAAKDAPATADTTVDRSSRAIAAAPSAARDDDSVTDNLREADAEEERQAPAKKQAPAQRPAEAPKVLAGKASTESTAAPSTPAAPAPPPRTVEVADKKNKSAEANEKSEQKYAFDEAAKTKEVAKAGAPTLEGQEPKPTTRTLTQPPAASMPAAEPQAEQASGSANRAPPTKQLAAGLLRSARTALAAKDVARAKQLLEAGRAKFRTTPERAWFTLELARLALAENQNAEAMRLAKEAADVKDASNVKESLDVAETAARRMASKGDLDWVRTRKARLTR